MSQGNKYFAQYESPNIVLVPSSNDGRSTPDSALTFAPSNLPCCENSAEQATAEHYTASTTYFTNPSNLNYLDTVYNYNNVSNHVNSAEESNLYVSFFTHVQHVEVNLLPQCSPFGSIENTANNAHLNIQQPTFQDHSWTNTDPTRCTNNIIGANMYATTSTKKIKNKRTENDINDTVTQETIDENGIENIVDTSTGAQKNEDIACKTDKANHSNKNNNGTNLIINEQKAEGFDKSNFITNIIPQDKRKKVCKSSTKNNTTKENSNRTNSKINKNDFENIASTTSKEKNEVTKPKTDLRYLWKRHCARLKDKIKEEIEGSEDMKTQLHTQWKAILKSEYNTFVKNFYSSAWISKNKTKSAIANKKNKKPNSEFKNKQSIPNSSNSNTKFTKVNKDNSIKRNNSLKSTIQAPKKDYLRKQYENVDLRTLLSRKRNQNICYESPKRMPKRPRERDNLIITVNQDIETHTQKPAAMEPNPKKKCNKIKLVINVVCNESDSEEESDHDDDDQCALLNEDLSFLDDFNVDDIVDSLNCDNLLDDTTSTKQNCTDNNMNKNEATNNGLNELCLIKPEKMDTADQRELAENNVDGRLPNNTSGTQNNTEVFTLDYNNDASILREINKIKNEFIAKIDQERNMGTIETESADPSIKNKTANDFFTQNGRNIKSENANLENDRDRKNCLDKHTNISAVTTDIGNINTKKTEYSLEKTNPIQVGDAKATKKNNVETQDLIYIKTEDDFCIVISDDESTGEDVTNTEIIEIEEENTNTQIIEIEEEKNSNLANEKITPEENAVVIEAIKNEKSQHNSNQNAQNVNKSIILDDIVLVKEDIEMKDPDLKKHVMLKESIGEISKNIEIPKKEVKSIHDEDKPNVSDQKHVSMVSNNISKFKDTVKNKQPNKMLGQKFKEKLELRMLDILDERYNIMGIINRGKFSKISKCANSKGDTFALKWLKSTYDCRLLGSLKEKMLMRLQKYIPREQLNIVYILNSFSMSRHWCFIMEYYPKNLEQALLESNKGFHINLVQALARQLAAAVTVLTNNSIVHTDIKPRHILLNSTYDKLKLCGFDESNYIQYLDIKPNTGTINYRAPEILLGFTADFRIDVWSTALVIFEMATGTKLFPGMYNNDILYKQMCTLGAIPRDMIERSAYKHYHFIGDNFMRIMDSYRRKQIITYFNKNKRLYGTLITSYCRDWQSFATKQEVFEDKAKLNGLHQLLEQMLVLDPRYRLPINFVGVSEFLQDNFS